MARAALGATIIVGLAAAPVAADTGGGGGTDLGLDAITITATTVDARSGVVTVSGVVECTADLEHVDIYAELNQPVGRLNSVQGWGSTSVGCLAEDGSAAFNIAVWPHNGRFAAGRAVLSASAYVFFCTEEDCFEDGVQFGPASVRVTRG